MKTMDKSAIRNSRMTSRGACGYLVSGAALVVMCWAVVAPAGSVFMKNGYIVQGPVVEHTTQEVVVEWPNGRVTIQSRFVEHVVLDPGEEKRLREKEAPAAAEVTSHAEELDRDIVLPSNPEDLFSNRKPGSDQVGMEPGAAVTVLPTVELGERQEIMSGLSGSLPQGWSLRLEGDSWVAEGPGDSSASGLRCRIAGGYFKKQMGRRSQLRLAKEEAQASFLNWQVIEEGYREISFREGYEIYGCGEHEGRKFQVRQIVVWVTDGVWLVSCVWPAKSDAAAAVEWFLQTLSFQ